MYDPSLNRMASYKSAVLSPPTYITSPYLSIFQLRSGITEQGSCLKEWNCFSLLFVWWLPMQPLALRIQESVAVSIKASPVPSTQAISYPQVQASKMKFLVSRHVGSVAIEGNAMFCKPWILQLINVTDPKHCNKAWVEQHLNCINTKVKQPVKMRDTVALLFRVRRFL